MASRMMWALLMSLISMTVFAHSTVKSTVPASGSTLTASPPELVINFNEPARLVSVIVTRVDSAERKLPFTPEAQSASFTVAGPKLQAGRNEITWRALSKDGHPIGGTILVVIKPEAASAAQSGLSTILLPEEQETQLALEAGPEQIRAQATVYVFRSKGYEKVRAGGNGFTCLVNRDGNQRGDNDLKPTCWDPEGSRTIVPVMLRVGELIAARSSADEIKRDIEAGFNAGRFSSPRRNGIAYMLKGDIEYDLATGKITRTRFPPHYMFYAPGVTAKDIGTDIKPAKDKLALPSVYAGYSGAPHTNYIIVLAAMSQEHSH